MERVDEAKYVAYREKITKEEARKRYPVDPLREILLRFDVTRINDNTFERDGVRFCVSNAAQALTMKGREGEFEYQYQRALKARES